MNQPDFQSLLNALREKHGVVGVSLGVLKGGAIESYASGLLNLNTQVECTPDSVFQIGSISKVFTATPIMQLVDEGRLSLEDPVVKHLPDFTLADKDAARATTVRQLLNHTSGIDGDFFPADDPEGPSTVSYVRKMCLLTNLYPPGQGPMTYSNSGFAVAGRIIEVLTCRTWQDAVMERICRPLRMPAAFAHPHESLRFRCAMGHIPDPSDPKKTAVAPSTYLPISMASVGSVLTMSVESVLRFAQVHMADGECNGVRLLSAESTRRMRDDTVPIPPLSRYGTTHWGLGWFLRQAQGCDMAGHDGGTRGQFAYLRLFPEHQIAFTALTNSTSEQFFRELEQHLMQSLLGTTVPADPPAEPFTVRPERYAGCYRNVASSYTVTREGDNLELHYEAPGAAVSEFRTTLAPYRRDVFEIRGSGTVFDGGKIIFLGEVSEGPKGHATFIRLGTRMARLAGTRPDSYKN